MRKKRLIRRRFKVAAAVAGSLGLLLVMHTAGVARGDWLDAVRGQAGPGSEATEAPAAPGRRRVVAEGRVTTYPGAEVRLAAEVAGRIVRLPVEEMQAVHKGDVLAELAADESRAELAEARSKVAELDAGITYFEWELERLGELSGTQAISAQELHECRRDLDAARARRQAAAASVARLEVHVDKARVLSPIDGTVTARFAHPGQMVEPASPILTVADLHRTRLEAEVNESDAGGVAPGAAATVTAEGYLGLRWRAKVEEVPDVVVSRTLKPRDPGRPTDAGVVLVKLKLLDPAPLKLGQRVEVLIETTPTPIADAR